MNGNIRMSSIFWVLFTGAKKNSAIVEKSVEHLCTAIIGHAALPWHS